MSFSNYAINILVTGSNGQLANEIKNISARFPFNFLFVTKEQLAIDNTHALQLFFEKHQVDYCINCAAYTTVDKAESDPETAYRINADAVGELATICQAHHTKLIHISTDYVFDGSKEFPQTESDAVAPLNVYGASKLKGEELALKKNPATLIIRTSWVYSSFGSNFVKTMLRLFKEKEAINVVNDQYGSPTYAADLAELIMGFIQKMDFGLNYTGIVNYSNSGVINWYEFALAIKELTGGHCKINPVPTSSYITPAKRPQYSILDTTKVKTLLQIEIPFWKDSLVRCISKLSAGY